MDNIDNHQQDGLMNFMDNQQQNDSTIFMDNQDQNIMVDPSTSIIDDLNFNTNGHNTEGGR